MNKFDHNTLLQACHSNKGTEEECRKLSHAAGMWACGEHKITRAEVRLANEILSRGTEVTEWWKVRDVETTTGHDEESAEFTTEAADASKYGEGFTVLNVTSGQNAGRRFLVKETTEGIVRGQRVFKSMTAAAGGFAKK